MVPEGFINYFLASAGASAALIGLLFVAISVAPERVFGESAPIEAHAVAGSAFFALLNAFFVSLIALLPRTNIGYAALVVAVTALINTLSLGRRLWDVQRTGRGPSSQQLTLLTGSVIVYLVEIALAVAAIGAPGHTGYVYGLAYLLLGAYGLGVSRAWELLGAQSEGLFTLLGIRQTRRTAAADAHREEHASPDTPPSPPPR